MHNSHPDPVYVFDRRNIIGGKRQGGFEKTAEHIIKDIAYALFMEHDRGQAGPLGEFFYQFHELRRCPGCGMTSTTFVMRMS